MTKESKNRLDQDEQFEIAKSKEETLASFIEEEGATVEETPKKRKNNASVSVDKFDWDAFEKDNVYDVDKSVIEDRYSQTLSKVIENEVVEGTVVALNKERLLLTSVTRVKVLSVLMSSVITQNLLPAIKLRYM